MDELIKPRLEEEKRKQLQQTKDDATEHAITTVKLKIKEQFDAEQAAREAEGEDSFLKNVLKNCIMHATLVF